MMLKSHWFLIVCVAPHSACNSALYALMLAACEGILVMSGCRWV